MTPTAEDEIRAAPKAGSPPSSRVAEPGPASRFWLRLLFWLAARAPWVLRILKPVGVWLAVRCSQKIRRNTAINAARIFGPDVSPTRHVAFAAAVTGNFYDFVVDVGRSAAMSAAQLRAGVESITGHEEYLATRKQGGGAIILTAHMGSFEVGLAALRELEPHIHVVFKRDAVDLFESMRRALRANLDVREAPIDDGLQTWMRLRDALAADHVVVMQGDRAMPGQKAQAVPVLGGHLLLPLGPFKLAEISGSPIIPVFVVRTASGKCRLFVEPAIRVDRGADLSAGVPPQLLQWGKVIEKFVAAYPDQWLLLDPAFVEDAGDSSA